MTPTEWQALDEARSAHRAHPDLIIDLEYLLAWDNVVHATWPGFDGESFDPEVWEVIK